LINYTIHYKHILTAYNYITIDNINIRIYIKNHTKHEAINI